MVLVCAFGVSWSGSLFFLESFGVWLFGGVFCLKIFGMYFGGFPMVFRWILWCCAGVRWFRGSLLGGRK